MGADVFARNAKGRTALDLALRHSANSSIVSSLRHSQSKFHSLYCAGVSW